LLSAPLLEPLEVTANRGTHVVEVAFVPHHGCVPARLDDSSPVGARSESANADSARAKIPEGVRFAAAALLLC
jgi:hypothetical protein